MNLRLLGAEVFNEDWWKGVSPARDVSGMLLLALAIIALLAVLWAAFIRKRRDEGSDRYTYPHLTEANGAADPISQAQSRRRRRRRLNPTLAERGGLPPMRGSEDARDPLS